MRVIDATHKLMYCALWIAVVGIALSVHSFDNDSARFGILSSSTQSRTSLRLSGAETLMRVARILRVIQEVKNNGRFVVLLSVTVVHNTRFGSFSAYGIEPFVHF